MDFFKLFLFATILFFGSSAHRFQRLALKNNGTHAKLLNGTNVDDRNLVEELAAADRTIVEQDNHDLKLVENGHANIQLNDGNKLKFEICSSFSSNNCLNQNVRVCFDAVDAEDSYHSVRGECLLGQCEFQAGVLTQESMRYLWLKHDRNTQYFDTYFCATAIMQSPKAVVSFDPQFDSCKPKIYDGNMVKVSVTGASSNCYLTIKNAKQWFPATTSPPTTSALSIAPPVQSTTEASLTAGTTAAIAFGCIFGVIALIAVIVIIVLCYRDHKKKQAIPRTVDGEPATTDPVKEGIVGDGKAEANKDTAQPNVPTAPKIAKGDEKEKKEAAVGPVEKKSKAKKHREQAKAKKAVGEKQPAFEEQKADEQVNDDKTKVSKEPVEKDPIKKVSTEPTFDDAATDPFVQQSPAAPKVQQPKPDQKLQPFVLIPTDAVHPIPKPFRAPHDSSSRSRSGRKDSLSDRNDMYMALVVEFATKTIGSEKMGLAAKLQLKAKMDKFCLQICVLETREIGLFCCSMELMFIKVEILIDDAAAQMSKLGCRMDENGSVVELSYEAEQYLADPATPAYVRCYAFGGVFRDLIDSKAGEKPIFSIQLLFIIALQRRYSAAIRQHALKFIRMELPIVKKYYYASELQSLPFPVNTIEEAYKMDPAGFNVLLEDKEDATQASNTRKSLKNAKKKDKAGKKHQAKK